MPGKRAILEALEVLYNKELQSQQLFKARAYEKVLSQIKLLPKVDSMEDLNEVKGIGKSIRSKSEELLNTGQLSMTEEIKSKKVQAELQELMQIHGIGPVKAKDLVEKNDVHSISQLKKAYQIHPHLLTEQQAFGLKYFDDLKLKIPRHEMEQHHLFLKSEICNFNSMFSFELVGSYRRGIMESNDIDILMTFPSEFPSSERSKVFRNLCLYLKSIHYIQAILALGDKRCMAICQLDNTTPARRIDFNWTSPEMYSYAILHATGSSDFEIEIRTHALKKGYSLNERGLKKINPHVQEVPNLSTEKDIFVFLEYPYIPPNKR